MQKNHLQRRKHKAASRSIRARRRALEVSQLDVATAIGISQSQYSLIEQGYVLAHPTLITHVNQILDSYEAMNAENATDTSQ